MTRRAQARTLLKQLIVGRLEMTPVREGQYYRFSGVGTLEALLSGMDPQCVASPPPSVGEVAVARSAGIHDVASPSRVARVITVTMPLAA